MHDAAQRGGGNSVKEMTLKIFTVKVRGLAPYSGSRAHESPKLPRETPDVYEVRTWRQKMHVTAENEVFIPPMALKQALDTASKMLGRQIPGKGKATYSKFFASGVLVMDPVLLGVHIHDVGNDRIHANADGVRGSGKRVWRIFPKVDDWTATVKFHVLANEIVEDVFLEHLRQAGGFVGVGRFRPQNGGFYGRFAVDDVKIEEIA